MSRVVVAPRRPPSNVVMAAALVSMVLIWGTTWAAIRVGLEGIPPFTGVAARFAIAGALLWLVARVLGLTFRASPVVWRLQWVHALLSFCVSYCVTYWAEQWVPSGLASVLFATFPLFVAIFAHFALPGERLDRRKVMGIVVGFAGVAVIFSEDFALLGGPMVATAAGVMLLSPIAAATSNVAIKRWGEDAHPVTLNASAMMITAGLVSGLALALERHREVHLTSAAVGSVLYLAVFGSAIAFVLYFWMLRHMEASKLALVAFAVPVVAVAVGAVLFREPVTSRTIGGTGLVLAGVVVASFRR